MLQGMKEPYRKGDSDSILALSLAGIVARCRLKLRQGYMCAGRLSFEKRNIRPRLSPEQRKATRLFRDNASEQSVLRSLRTRAR
jgi:hypothetical protein